MALHHSKSNNNPSKSRKSVSGKFFYEDDANRSNPKLGLKSKEKPEKAGKNKWRAHEFELGGDDDE